MKVLNRFPLVHALVLTLALLVSCNKLPETDFTYSPLDNPETGDIIRFENTTPEVSTFEWDFGDGITSNLENPGHVFESPGNFEVTLTTSNDAGDQEKRKTIVINDPTILAFLIVDSTETIPLEDAELWVFYNEDDWNNFSNPMLIGYADSTGYVEFTNMESMVYYIWAIRNENDGFWISGGYTPALTLNEINDYYLPCVWYSYVGKKASIDSPYSQYSSPAKLLRMRD